MSQRGYTTGSLLRCVHVALWLDYIGHLVVFIDIVVVNGRGLLDRTIVDFKRLNVNALVLVLGLMLFEVQSLVAPTRFTFSLVDEVRFEVQVVGLGALIEEIPHL